MSNLLCKVDPLPAQEDDDRLPDLLSQVKALNAQIERVREAQRAQALAQIQALMTEYGISSITSLAQDAEPKTTKRAHPSKGKPVKVKYWSPGTDETWTGRGKRPKWLNAAIAAGATLESFEVPAQG